MSGSKRLTVREREQMRGALERLMHNNTFYYYDTFPLTQLEVQQMYWSYIDPELVRSMDYVQEKTGDRGLYNSATLEFYIPGFEEEQADYMIHCGLVRHRINKDLIRALPGNIVIKLSDTDPRLPALQDWYSNTRDNDRRVAEAKDFTRTLWSWATTSGQVYRLMPELAQIVFNAEITQRLVNQTMRKSRLPNKLTTPEATRQLALVNDLVLRGKLLGQQNTEKYNWIDLLRSRL